MQTLFFPVQMYMCVHANERTIAEYFKPHEFVFTVNGVEEIMIRQKTYSDI